jgi:Domain of unknown function (DUF4381)
MNPLTELMEQLHDIEGLDPASWWPLAPGWWLLIAIALLLILGVAWFAACKFAFYRSWKNDTLQKLAVLEKNLNDDTARTTLMLLSEYLRRMAMQRFPRKECAGLTGESWLKWLAAHDPKKFDWENKGVLLIEVPYAPVKQGLPASQIGELIQAAKQWVH